MVFSRNLTFLIRASFLPSAATAQPLIVSLAAGIFYEGATLIPTST